MPENVKPKRRYDASRRQDQARATRRALLDAASRMFFEQGYAATSVAAIAAEVGVSVETVYKAFRNKPGLVKALFDIAVGGDDEDVALEERAQIGQIQAEPDGARKLERYVAWMAERQPAVAPIELLARLGGASDRELATVWEQTQEERLTGMTHFAEHLVASGVLRAGPPVEEVRDVLWTYNSVELYDLLVTRRGWPLGRYADWITRALVAALVTPGG